MGIGSELVEGFDFGLASRLIEKKVREESTVGGELKLWIAL